MIAVCSGNACCRLDEFLNFLDISRTLLGIPIQTTRKCIAPGRRQAFRHLLPELRVAGSPPQRSD